MKTVQEKYAFSKSEIKILRELVRGERPLSDLRKKLLFGPSLLSYNLKKLLDKGLIMENTRGFRKYVQFSDFKHASLLKNLLLVYYHIDWENLLVGKGLYILFQIISGFENSFYGVSKATFWRYLRRFRTHGILQKKVNKYEINPRFSILADFLNEYQLFFIKRIAEKLSSEAVVLWHRDFEFLVRVPKSVKVTSEKLHLTATSLFPSLGLPIFSEYNILFYSERKKNIKIEDAVLHTLLIERKNVRYVIYSLLLLHKYKEKIDVRYLKSEAQKYNLGVQIVSMLSFIVTHSRQGDLPLPTWTEFEAKAKEYGVTV